MSTAVLTMPEVPESLVADAGLEEVAEDKFYEVVDGRRVEIPAMSAYAAKVASRLCFELGLAARASKLGEVVIETLFRIPQVHDQTRNRRPDLAYVSFERWPAEKPMPLSGNAWDVVPDLAVEVISPNDLLESVIEKVDEYFRGSVKLVWVVMPVQRQVYVYQSPTQVRIIAENDILDGGDLIPEFRLTLASILDAPQPRISQDE